MDYIKSCKAELSLTHNNKNYSIISTELLRFNTLKSDNLLEFINSIKPHIQFTVDSKCGVNDKIISGDTLLHNVTRYGINTTPHSFDKDFVCRVTANSKPPKKEPLPSYYLSILGVINNPEIDFLNRHNAQSWYMVTPDFVILPDIASKEKLFSKDYISLYNELNITTDIDLLYDFFSDIQFSLFIKDRSIKSLFSLTKQHVPMLKLIKTTIYDFYRRFFKFEIDTNRVEIFINSDTKYDFIVINFIMFNVYTGNRLMSFIDLHRNIKLNDVIEKIENNEDLYYFTRVQYKDVMNVDCSDNYALQLGGGDDIIFKPWNKPKLLDLLYPGAKEIKILNREHYGNRVHAYCSEFYLLSVDSVPYELSFKSVTYKALKKNLAFKKIFIDKLKLALNEEPVSYDKELNYIFPVLPAMVEVYTKKIDHYEPSFNFFIEESPSQYTQVLKEMKAAPERIDSSVVLHLLWKAMFKVYNIESRKNLLIAALFDVPSNYDKHFLMLTKKVLQNEYLGAFILDDFIYSKNFTFNFRMGDNNTRYILYIVNYLLRGNVLSYDTFKRQVEIMVCKNNFIYKNLDFQPFNNPKVMLNKDDAYELFNYLLSYITDTTTKYIMWYTPNIYPINYDILLTMIQPINYKVLNDYFVEYDSFNKIINEYRRVIPLIYMYTNFKDLYSSIDFVHNVRHISGFKNEIDDLIKAMYFHRKKYSDETFLVFAHYPNNVEFNIFHMHTFGAAFDFAEKTTTNYINLTLPRSLLWTKQVKYTEYKDKTMLLKLSRTDRLTEDIVLKKYGRLNLKS